MSFAVFGLVRIVATSARMRIPPMMSKKSLTFTGQAPDTLDRSPEIAFLAIAAVKTPIR